MEGGPSLPIGLPGDREARLRLLSETSSGTPMGRLLRTFWQPVARSETVASRGAKGIRVMGEELTLYRGASGRLHLVGGRCAHRCTLLHTGRVEGEELRCLYHGWRYDASGQCTEMPAERRIRPDNVRIAAYPVEEYAGLVFAYLGDAPAPPFDLPRKPFLEDASYLVVAREEVWDCNWFQQIENSLDAVHVSFVHGPHWGLVSRFAEELTTAIPDLAYEETNSGIRQIATRSDRNVRVSDWTFPNNNHVISPGPRRGDPWTHTVVWGTPIDDRRTMRFYLAAIPKSDPETDQRIAENPFRDYNPADHYDALFNEHRFPETGTNQLISTQDYVVLRGQGEIVDRTKEYLVDSDAGIVFLRRIFFREMEALVAGRPPKRWARLEDAAHMTKPEPAEA